MTYDSFGRFPNKLSRNPGPVSQVDASQCHPERSEWAQHDRAVTHTAALINVFMYIIALIADSSAQRRLSTPT